MTSSLSDARSRAVIQANRARGVYDRAAVGRSSTETSLFDDDDDENFFSKAFPEISRGDRAKHQHGQSG